MKVTPVKRSAATTLTPQQLTALWGMAEDWTDLHTHGYRRLSECPEVISAVDRIASLGSMMTIRMMQNTKEGDIRVKDALSRKIDISPYSNGTRATFVAWIIQTMMLGGDGNAFVLPVTKSGYLEDLQPLPPVNVSILDHGTTYEVDYNGVSFAPDDVLHFRLQPDVDTPWKGRGYRVQLRDVLDNLRQARATEKGFMASKWKPSVIIRVDSIAEEFSSAKKRSKFLNDYIATEEAGQPWVIPADLLDVHQVKPLSLNDLAINDTVTLDKKTVAALLGVPSFLLGVGTFNKEEYNNFISSVLMPIMTGIQQEMTKKLLTSTERYFRFNPRSLYAYSISELASVGKDLRAQGVMTGNEVRDWVGLPPMKGLDELVMLENYIPTDKLGDQKKLTQKEGSA